MPSFWESNEHLVKLGLPKSKGFKLGVFMSMLQGISAIGLLALSAWLISRAAQMPPILYLQMAIVGVRGFALGRAFFRYVERVTLHDSAFQMLSELRPKVFAKVVPLAPAGLGSANRADTVNRLVNDVDEIQNLPLRVVSPLLQSFTVSVLTLVAFAFLVPEASLYLMAALLVCAGLAMPMSARMAKSANESMAGLKSRLSVDTMTFLENLDVIDAYGWNERQLGVITTSQDRLLSAARIQSISTGLGAGLFSLLTTLATVMTTYFGGLAVTDGKLPGVMLAVIALVPLGVFDVLQNAQPAIGAWQRYKSSATRIHELLTAAVPAEVAANPGDARLESIQSLELIEVAIAYPGQSVPAVKDVNLSLRPGQTLLLRGPSGNGKSTIASLLAGFIQPSAGTYLINGQPHSTFSTSSLRARIGYLEQDPTIFMGTLRANLLIAKPAATDEELWAMLRRVKLATTFEIRDGLDTHLGERGSAVSGGEAQRIALARALLADFSVLIFDEPTANLDADTAEALWTDLLQITSENPNRASIFISHDPRVSNRIDHTILV